MSETLPPLTPPECDLRGYEYMPLHGHNLFGSEFWVESSDAERVAALSLWWAAWLQCPAGSLPTSDAALASHAGYGRDIKGWLKVKTRAMHGFVQCSDGRLYHAFLCERALVAYDARIKADRKRAADRKRLQEWREARSKPTDETPKGGGDGNGMETSPETLPETAAETVLETADETRFVAGRSEVKREIVRTELRSDADASPKDARTELWHSGLQSIRTLTGLPDASAKALLGKLCKSAGDNCANVNRAIAAAIDLRPGDPVAWLTQACRSDKPQRETVADSIRRTIRQSQGVDDLYDYSKPGIQRITFDA